MEKYIDEIIQAPTWSATQEKVITAPFHYLKTTPGKHLRTQLIQLFNTIYKLPQSTIDQISTIIEMLHTASLLIDDVEDGSNLRRGNPTAHLIFGVAYTINSSNYMYFQALQQLLELDPQLVTVFNEEMINLHRGQSLDLYWRENLICPKESEYINMVMNKTGGLFRLAVRLMEHFAKTTDTTSLIPLANYLGIIYQIRDDYLNLKSEDLTLNKGFCEDISEGKFSFPIIHSLNNNRDDQTLMGILKQRTQDIQIKKFALNFLEETNSFQYTLETLNLLREKTLSWVDQYDGHQDTTQYELDNIKQLVLKLTSV
ncbi:Geranylgeranyl pyrophosphate synthetase [Wickerhamomyces ciferrii]|uniref:Geranylgeranyl pyrophosphate synthetase n=1 Tax=Wickerhamomyces ciferrii (strain ATCC 14091 / BCRC 22168 / CBS 111 / JCM 3599 / NBRC 0793 / NRRL Y-1031 F-60-10) TaxID=1206466 RepID=K0KU33_WICCF|nr:Geranylgeranyl pyrophosphate synthetase [Wickerhamomyces ciferrii]CCH44924.1 Geranylgeranyl pyrophosphate synthetase [Wickerhamomyces ciferrii]